MGAWGSATYYTGCINKIMGTKISSVEFIKGVIGTDDIFTDGVHQFAFIGRSNVGKSSVINSLLQRKNFAKSSATPGKTQQINFFLVNGNVYFVDLPGYGFAKLSKEKREKLRKMILWYFAQSGANPKKVILVVDAKVGPSNFDIEMSNFLTRLSFDVVIVANKLDKLNQSEKIKNINLIRSKLLQDNIVLYSAKTGSGRESLLNILFENK